MQTGPLEHGKRTSTGSLAHSGDTWLDILDQMPVAVAIAEAPSGKLLWHSHKAEEILGHPIIPASGTQDYARYGGVHEDGTPYQADEYPLARAARYGEVIERELLRYRRGDGRMVILEFNASRVTGPDGQAVAICSYQDVTKDHEQQGALREAAERIDLALDAGATVGTWVWNVADDVFTADERFATFFGLDAERCRTGFPSGEILSLVNPEDRPALLSAITAAFARGGAYRHQYRVVQPGGADRWVEASGRVELDASGKAARFPGIIVDITAWKQAEEARSLLMREVDHRARNVLAMVQSVVRLTDACDPRRYREEVIGRIDAMARAQGSLSRSNWEGGVLADLISDELSSCGSSQQFTLTGPRITLPADQVQPLSMIVHEMATNAMKYGALSVPAGTLEVTSKAIHRREIVLTWRERGGPAISPPKRTGFGSRLINRLAAQLGGSLELDWQPGGLVATLRWPC
jgi:PAS domain S-box-containing protein